MIYEAIDYWNSPPNSYLEHHGIKGMKWGVRHDKPRLSRKQKRLAKSDYGKAKSMSDQELQRTINRINLEQNYISAIKRDRAAYKDATSSVLSKWGRKTVNSIFSGWKSANKTGEKMVKNTIEGYYLSQIPLAGKHKV